MTINVVRTGPILPSGLRGIGAVCLTLKLVMA